MPYPEAPVIPAQPGYTSRSFREVVAEHQRGVYFLALDLTGQHQDAEDLSQEVFIKAYKNLGDFRGEASLKTWLFRITVNTYLNSRRRKMQKLTRVFADFAGRAPDQQTHHRTDQDTRERLLNEHVQRALERLTEKERTAFVLRHYHEYALKEVADTMGLATGSIKSLLFRALKKLRHELAFLRDEKETL